MKSGQAFLTRRCCRQYRVAATLTRAPITVPTARLSTPTPTPVLTSSLSCFATRVGCPASCFASVHTSARGVSTSASVRGDEDSDMREEDQGPSHAGRGRSETSPSRSGDKKRKDVRRKQKKGTKTTKRRSTKREPDAGADEAAVNALFDEPLPMPTPRQPYSTISRPPSMAEARAAVVGDETDDHNSGDEKHTSSGATAPLTSAASAASDSTGWRYDDVDPQTGQTRLDKLYESQLSRLHVLMSQPLPPLPPDGSLNPDLFLGFAHYHYRLRDEYRALVARELAVPVQAVRLSVAWSGRFDVTRFHRVQKVCGVFLDRDVLGDVAPTTERRAAHPVSASSVPPLPAALAERVQRFITAINQRQSERLLSAQLVQASEPIPEVEFAMTRLEQQWLAQLHRWIHRHVLQSSLAVLVTGGNTLYRYSTTIAAGEATAKTTNTTKSSCTAADVMAAIVKDEDEAARQGDYVARHWLKMFHNRQVVPRVLPDSALAARLAEAVAHAEDVEERDASASSTPEELESASERAKPPPSTGTTPSMLETLPTHVQTFLKAVVKAIEDTPTAPTSARTTSADETALTPLAVTEEDARYARAFTTALSALRERDSTTQHAQLVDGAVSWWRLCREALLFQHATSPARGTSSSGAHGGADVTHDADVFYRFSSEKIVNRGDLPAAFVHGAFLGGIGEMHYLLHNRAALDAVVLHPNDVDFKKKFVRRMKSGHSRLQLETEAKSPYTDD